MAVRAVLEETKPIFMPQRADGEGGIQQAAAGDSPEIQLMILELKVTASIVWYSIV